MLQLYDDKTILFNVRNLQLYDDMTILFNVMMMYICLVPDQESGLDFYSASSLQQQPIEDNLLHSDTVYILVNLLSS